LRRKCNKYYTCLCVCVSVHGYARVGAWESGRVHARACI
jgi:hypothetical protein